MPLLPPSKNLATEIKEKVNGSGTQMNDCWLRDIQVFSFISKSSLNNSVPIHGNYEAQ
jgi:hypothetical protein